MAIPIKALQTHCTSEPTTCNSVLQELEGNLHDARMLCVVQRDAMVRNA